MTQVLMTKGTEEIYVDSTAVTAHEAVGWKRAEIDYGKYELKIPHGDDLNLERGKLLVNGLENVLMQHYQVAPALGTATYVHAAIALTAAAQTISSGITDPDVPRVITVKGNTTGMTGGVVIYGTNILDELITDTIALSGVSEVAGIKAFKTILSIVVPVKTHTSGDTVSVGTEDVLGLPHIMEYALCLRLALFDGTADTGGSLALDDDEVEKNLYTPAGTLDGSTLLDLYYLAEGL